MKYLKEYREFTQSDKLGTFRQSWENIREFVKPQTGVKKGISELFDSNPELISIGTQEQYSTYLDSIFPNSKFNDIVYHSTNAEFEVFDPSKAGSRKEGSGSSGTDLGAWGVGMYFTPNAEYTKVYGKNKHAVIVNITNPKTIINNEADDNLYTGKSIKELWGKNIDGVIQKVTNWEQFLYKGNPHGTLKDFQSVGLGFKPEIVDVVVTEAEQIHVLGSKQDIEGFKKFTKSYLKTYELFEKNLLPSLKDEIKDILLEVEDMDYQVEYKYEIDKWNPYPSIRINPKSDKVNEDPNLSPGSPGRGEFISKVYLPDIEDAIDRLKEVCKQRGYHVNMSVQTPTAKTWMENGELKYKTHPPKTYNWVELQLR